MTYLKDVFGRDMFAGFDKVFVGFDDQFNKLAKIHDDLAKNIPNYPFYNVKKTDENKYVVEIAVAGFSENEIEIEIADDKLIIKGNTSVDEEENFLFKGISKRPFTRAFALDDKIEVANAEMINGMLKVFLERIIPEHKKPQKIEINKPAKKDTRQVLTEQV